MKQINVIDFDKTLIPFDSFGLYIKNGIKKLNFSIIYFTLLRLFRVIDNSTFKQKVIRLSLFNPKEQQLFEDYLISCINVKIRDKIKKHTDENTINILCSASPNFYISKISERINMIGYGSRFVDENIFIHLYGNTKADFILQKYPKELYHYKYAISDSKSDLKLLSLFEESELIP